MVASHLNCNITLWSSGISRLTRWLALVGLAMHLKFSHNSPCRIGWSLVLPRPQEYCLAYIVSWFESAACVHCWRDSSMQVNNRDELASVHELI